MMSFSMKIFILSINRNILECKGRCPAEQGDLVSVLIETYWNVKINTHCIVSMIGLRINRNILECKDVTSTDEPGQRNKY